MMKRVTLTETPILRDMRTTARDLGITAAIRDALACGCPCAGCHELLALALHDLTLASERDAATKADGVA